MTLFQLCVIREAPREVLDIEANAVQLPFWAIVSFGAFLLFKLGYNVMTFNDVPEAYAELMGEIDIAKSELRLKGIEVD